MIPFLGGIALGAFAGTVLLMRNLWDWGDRINRREQRLRIETWQRQLAAIDQIGPPGGWRDLERVDSV